MDNSYLQELTTKTDIASSLSEPGQLQRPRIRAEQRWTCLNKQSLGRNKSHPGQAEVKASHQSIVWYGRVTISHEIIGARLR
ncbi:hypothetical protein JTE90_013589 [Oedothorax gibbosus]|uniref:Uncharacterized protein n=1 Tax=Oedothorax gibbosus TaxID=931172 RepID=A0AAV6VGL4_9ARAC|nr:hypothetical protein JTE90_013589 [Oedothorax gibbosus]